MSLTEDAGIIEGDSPPPLFILFKGKKNGKIARGLAETCDLPEWLRVQVQDLGSYREEDVLEALAAILPVARSTEESIVVMLDWKLFFNKAR